MHAGVVRNQGGYVDVMPVDKRKVYVASFQNGIYSERYRAHLQRLHFALDLHKVHSLVFVRTWGSAKSQTNGPQGVIYRACVTAAGVTLEKLWQWSCMPPLSS